ncbi:hypothetical protein KP806_25820 [Paenibacillus sp. N4]|uniref:hypothetical protein n=1 Tax=Paenibacillus vietnamensis TaxID=2590547 RepID=UPI001CD04849|nr:hypothetical protein [Paenibacillus vietnamensis]MCA0758479.1 hypothetical protein [Paenibacillus vietnamensis]
MKEKAKDLDGRLFAGERSLVIVGLLGLALAGMIAVYTGFNGAAVGPEGNLHKAFSFDAAIGLFILSIAAIMPLAGLSPRKRKVIRVSFIQATLYSYAVETIQHFRGINPRFTREGTLADTIFGGLFGLESLIIIIVTVLVAISFFRKRRTDDRVLTVLGIRYAFLSTMLAFAGGIWMIALQGRYTGDQGNLIVSHGLGFHALQALPLLGLLLEHAQVDGKRARTIVHAGSIAWTSALVLIMLQTALGRTVFELGPLPILACILLLLWLAAAAVAVRELLLRPAGGMSSLLRTLTGRIMDR